MLRKVLAIALAIMLISSVTAFACGGDKTANNQKTSTEKYTGTDNPEATVKAASATSAKMDGTCAHPENCTHSADCPYLEKMKSASADQGTEATVKQANYSDQKAKACSGMKATSAVKEASAVKSGNCAASCTKAKDATNTATKDVKKVDPEKTVMVDQKEPAGDM